MARPLETDPYELWKQQGRPGGSFRASQGGAAPGAAPQAPQAAPMATPQAGGVPSSTDPLAFQAWYNQQQGGNRSEDMARFIVDPQGNLSGDTLSRWDPYLIREGPNAGKYRSMRGAEGVFDKPTECPPGMGPSGGDERNPCTTVGYSTPNPWESGAGAAASPQAVAAPGATADPLQAMLAQVQQTQPQASPAAATGAVPTVGQSNLQTMQGALQGLMTQNQAPQVSAGVPKQLGTGWQVGTDGLSQMMQKQQRIAQPQRGPGVGGASAGRWF